MLLAGKSPIAVGWQGFPMRYHGVDRMKCSAIPSGIKITESKPKWD